MILMKKEDIKSSAADFVAENIISSMPYKDLELEKLFIKHHFDMMIELGKLGVIVSDCKPDSKDGIICYESTLPFQFSIKDENDREYTHYTAAQKAKNIIIESRKKISEVVDDITREALFKDENIHFYYKLRDDNWDNERMQTYISLLIEEKNKTIESIDNIIKSKDIK